ncbi:MAG TPA: cytochrome P450 [Terriglobia bacterium]|nr:cytochrome P450 [Terriglobia bacterium]
MKSRWFSGSAYALRSNTLDFYSDCERTAGLVKTHLFGLPIYVVTDPLMIEDVLVRKHRCFVKSAGLRATQRGFGQGLLTSDRELWRQQRRIMQPAFQTRRVEQYRDSMERATERLLASIGPGGERNIHRDMTDLCFEALASSLFGEDVTPGRELIAQAAFALHGFHEHYSRWIGSLGGILFALIRTASTAFGRPDFVIDPSRLPTAYARKFREAMDAIDGFVETMIRRRRSQPKRNDLLEMLLSATDDSGRPLTHQQIRDEVVTMFFAGHETGAAALTWTLYLLARHPEIAAKLAKQIETGDEDEVIDQVLREAMRLYPPAYRISRTVVETCKVGGMEVRAGGELVIPQWAVHRSPRYYEEPERFRPERWTEEFTARLPKFAYFPFGGGPRTCIGNTFGMIESKFVLANLLRRFEIAPADEREPELDLGVTLLPKDNVLKLKLSRRGPASEPATRARTTQSRCPFHGSVAATKRILSRE